MPQVEEEFGAPLWVVHRADLQMVLLTASRKAGIDVQTGHHVNAMDFGSDGVADILRKPRYQVNEGEWLEADVILCADGIKSHIRRDMMKIHGQTVHGTSPISSCGLVLLSDKIC
jgi:salicylate hydroxylase